MALHKPKENRLVMETQGSNIFHKLNLNLTPKKLKKVLKDKHSYNFNSVNNNGKLLLHHPSPYSFSCIDLVFMLSNNWSPYLCENLSIHLNKLSQLLIKTLIVYVLFDICDTFSAVDFHRCELQKRIEKNKTECSGEDIRTDYIKYIARNYVNRFSKLNVHKTLMKIRKSFETSVRWYIALGFVPTQLNKDLCMYSEVCEWAFHLYQHSKKYNDDLQMHLVTYFAVLEHKYRQNVILSPVSVKHNILISSKNGWYTATNYDGENIELLSFDELYPDCTSTKVSLAGSMLPHEYLYSFAHDTYAIQTTQKLSQSTIVVSSEPSFSLATKKCANDNEKNTLNSNLNSLQNLQKLYEQMSDEGRRKLEFNPTTITMLDPERPGHNQVKVLKDMFQKLKDKALTTDFNFLDESEISTFPKGNFVDIHDDPKTNKQKSFETIQEVDKKSYTQQLERKLNESVKTINSLRTNLTSHIDKNAIDNLTIYILQLEKEEETKKVKSIKQELHKMTKLNTELTKQIDNMGNIVKGLTSRINVTKDENSKLVNMIMKGKCLQEGTEGDMDTIWVMTPQKRTEIINLFLKMLNLGKEENLVADKNSMTTEQQYENILIELKMEVIPLFYKVRNRKHLDLYNSWVSKDIQDRVSSFSLLLEADQEAKEKDKIEIYETPSLKLIDINPISAEERHRIHKLADNTLDGSSILGGTGTSGSLFTKKFYNIQFPQAGNVDVAIDKGIKEMWNQMIKSVFVLDPPMYTITGQEIMPGPSQGTYEKFIIPYLTFILGGDDNIRETVALVMRLENKQMFEHGAKDLNTFLFDEIFYFFWDHVI